MRIRMAGLDVRFMLKPQVTYLTLLGPPMAIRASRLERPEGAVQPTQFADLDVVAFFRVLSYPWLLSASIVQAFADENTSTSAEFSSGFHGGPSPWRESSVPRRRLPES